MSAQQTRTPQRRLTSWLAWVLIGGGLVAYMVNRMVSWFSGQNVFYSDTPAADPMEMIAGIVARPFWIDTARVPAGAAIVAWVTLAAIGMTKYDYGGQREAAAAVKGHEHGDARWARDDEMASFAHTSTSRTLYRPNRGLRTRIQNRLFGKHEEYNGQPVSDPVPEWCGSCEDDNYILTSKARMHASANPDRFFERNKHVCILGGSGSGKTFNYVGPNLLNLCGSYVVTDPKGDTLKQYGNFFLKHGYRLVVVNTKDVASFKDSMRYNPLMYIQNQASILTLVNLIIENTNGDSGHQAKEDFFVKAERQLYSAMMAYVFYSWHDSDPSSCTIPMILDLINLAKPEDGGRGQGPTKLDVAFHGMKDATGKIVVPGFEQVLVAKYGSLDAATKSEEWFAITMYDGFKVTAKSPETEASILSSCLVRLAPFAIDALREMFSADELHLERIGEERTAVFLVMSDTDKTFNFILAMLLYQLFDINTCAADRNPGSHCKIPVNCILDEFANIGRVPDCEVKIATLRSRWINMHIVLQSVAQLKGMYGDKAPIIEGNCDTTVMLGGCDAETNKALSERLGKYTVTTESTSVSRSSTGSSTSTSYQPKEMPLLSPEDLDSNPEKFSPDDALVLIKRAHPYMDAKYRTFDHPRYPELKEAGEFSLERWAWQRRSEEAEVRRQKAMRIREFRQEVQSLRTEFQLDEDKMSPTQRAEGGQRS